MKNSVQQNGFEFEIAGVCFAFFCYDLSFNILQKEIKFPLIYSLLKILTDVACEDGNNSSYAHEQ